MNVRVPRAFAKLWNAVYTNTESNFITFTTDRYQNLFQSSNRRRKIFFHEAKDAAISTHPLQINYRTFYENLFTCSETREFFIEYV